MDYTSFIPLIAVALGFAVAIPLVVYSYKLKARSAGLLAKQIIESAETQAKNHLREIELEAKAQAMQITQKAEAEAQAKFQEVRNSQRTLEGRELKLDGRAESLDRKEIDLKKAEAQVSQGLKEITEEKDRYAQMIEQENQKLEEISRMSQEEAKNHLMENMKELAEAEAAITAKQIRDQAISSATKEAHKIVISAIQRSAADHTAESTVSVVELPSDQMKGRVIGREGRNIRTFEQLTGVELIVDDTPEAVVLSGFDPVRREVARVALSNLVQDGRIHPARIEEMIEKATKQVDEEMKNAAEEALSELHLPPFHEQIMKLIGRLKYRTSYGQNILKHSIEVGWLTGLMAAELNLDGVTARRAGFLHDLGKAVDRNTDGTHALIGGEYARKFGEPDVVVNAIESHHEEVPMTGPISALVQSADAISGSRRGARGDTLESYIKRLRNLEGIATGFEGVSKSYAIQAGREVRVLVESDKIDDTRAQSLSSDIAGRIEEEMTYPGQIKVVVIRESRNTAIAK
ncbi:MAG: ribonuclease Y [Candidatus Marinimicrobia bacterium]|nr:ribonuclease Y [Candidatus Neomarinimicrobiota bacterium]MCF7850667.1 ribonuclease Y [Candidatus Neomarinimicrobiota bacterium]MCF7904470.1 ribonuclease Y [Candidatus Neomarinimicrobiota bacterium]